MRGALETVSIVCFTIAGILLVSAVAVFFRLQITQTVRELSGRGKLSQLEKREKQRKKNAPKPKIKEKLSGESVTKTQVTEDEAPTTYDDGGVKQESLVGFYEKELPTDIEQPTAPQEYESLTGKGSMPDDIPTTEGEGAPSLNEEEKAQREEETSPAEEEIAPDEEKTEPCEEKTSTNEEDTLPSEDQKIQDDIRQYRPFEASAEIQEAETEEPDEATTELEITETILLTHAKPNLN